MAPKVKIQAQSNKPKEQKTTPNNSKQQQQRGQQLLHLIPGHTTFIRQFSKTARGWNQNFESVLPRSMDDTPSTP